MLASVLQEMGLKDDALAYFERLTQTCPQSIHLSQSYINIGDYYFDNNDAMKALAAYKEAAKFQEAQSYGYALYKLAWCYYNVQRYDQAIENMQRLIDLCEKGEAPDYGTITSSKLQREALKDIAIFYAKINDMNGAVK